jgi:hypothetical protein
VTAAILVVTRKNRLGKTAKGETMDMNSIVTVLQAVLAVLVVSSILIGLLSLRNELRRSRRRRLAFLTGEGRTGAAAAGSWVDAGEHRV